MPQGSAGYTVAPRRRNGMGTASLVLGIVSLVLALLFVFSAFALILGPLAVIFGIVGISRASRGEADNRGQAIAGLVTGAISFLLVVALGIRIATLTVGHGDDFSRFGNCMRTANTDDEFANCFTRLSRELD